MSEKVRQYDLSMFTLSVLEKLMTLLKSHCLPEHDLIRMKEWLNSKPSVPDDAWSVTFGSFTLCGSGRVIGNIKPNTEVKLSPNVQPVADDLITALESRTKWEKDELVRLTGVSPQLLNKLARQKRLPSYPFTTNKRVFGGPELADWLREIEEGPRKKRKKK